MMKIKHSLVVPCFNEEGNVENFLREVREKFSNYPERYEIIFVNDGSRDATPKKLRQLVADTDDISITVINFSRNFGKEAAMYAGFTKARGEYVTVIDADLQQDPKYVLEMEAILDEDPDCDMVAAYQAQRHEGKFITFCKSSFYKVITKMSGIDFVSDASDFRTLRRSVVDTILALPEYHRFSKGIFSWVGYNTRTIPYEVRDRESGETKWNFKKLLRYAFEGIMAYTDAPLKLPFFFSAAMLILAVVMLVLTFCLGSAWIILAVAFAVGSILSFSQGLLGAYVGKIHTEVKDRPIFIAKEILTNEHD
ncbi:MAG: glycosyltransferase family 2 protein [Acutalibacteraceae bacterium]